MRFIGPIYHLTLTVIYRPRSVLVSLVIAVICSFGSAHGATLITVDGASVEGEVISATDDAIVIRRSIGGVEQMEIDSIDEVRIETDDGKTIVGEFLSWADGSYRLKIDDSLLTVRFNGEFTAVPSAKQTTPSVGSRPDSAEQGLQPTM